jgi:hypothetical protein
MANDKREQNLVDEVNENTMDGDTPLEKWLNAYLTSSFILKKAVPADECLSEAKTIIKQVAAATAEAQADGWVDVAVRLPPAKEGWNHSEQCLVWYQPSLDAVGNYGIAYYHYDPPYRPCEWVDFAHLGRDPIAWQPLPAPYQRQSSEGE